MRDANFLQAGAFKNNIMKKNLEEANILKDPEVMESIRENDRAKEEGVKTWELTY